VVTAGGVVVSALVTVFAITIAIAVVVTNVAGFVETSASGACTIGGINVRSYEVEGMVGELDGLSDATLDDDLVIETVRDLRDGLVVRDGETSVHVGKVEGPDAVTSVGVFEIDAKPVGEVMSKQFSVAHSVGSGDSGNLVTGLNSIVQKDGGGKNEGRTVLIVERGHAAHAHLDDANGRHRGRFRPALAAELVEKSLMRPGCADVRGVRPTKEETDPGEKGQGLRLSEQ